MNDTPVLQVEFPKPKRFRRRSNKRVVVQRKPLSVSVVDGVAALGRGLGLVVRKLARPVLMLAFFAAVIVGGRWGLLHVLKSPRFALAQILVGPTQHISHAEVINLAGVELGAKLLSVDPDEVAARVAQHPWVFSVHVERKLPAALQIDIVERNAAAVAMLGGLYLVDEEGHAFKRATTAEAAGLVIFTGIEREQYTERPDAVRAAYKDALGLLAEYSRNPKRPKLSEIRIDPRYGYSLHFLQSGAEVRLGNSSYSEKLARLDQILDALQHAGLDAPGVLRIVHLDGPADSRVSMRLSLGDS
ncbi:MAG: FtsQ-type POTRA domain-containing protein [Deltaproteobacteria bacterium]|nr:FtsQ-type POTRA domain-containing protein [Deltaproteobacteria bacterium]